MNATRTITAVLEANISNYVAGMRRAHGAMQDFATEQQKTLDAMGKVGKGATVAGLGIAAALGGAVKISSEFGAQMSKVGALSGASAEDMKKLSDAAKHAGATTKFSAKQAGQGFEYMALAGWKTNEMLDGLPGIMNLAAASGEDLGKASDIVTDGLSAFGLQAKDSARFADVLAKASSSTNTSVSQMGEAFKYSAASANAAGLEVENAAAFIGVLADSGIKGSSGGTVLNAVLRDMKNKAKDGAIAIGETSVAIYDAEGNMRGFSDIIADVESATNGMSDAQRDAALMSIFGDEAMRGMNIALNDGSDKLKKLEKAFYNAEGSAEKMAKMMQDNLQGDLTNLSSALEGAAIAIGEKLEPALRRVVQAITAVVSWFNQLDDRTQTVIAIIATLSATFLLLLGPILIIISLLPSFMAGLSLLGITFSSTLGIVAGVVAALGALASLIFIYWEPVTAFFADMWSGIVSVFTSSIATVSELVDTAFSGIANAVTSVGDTINSALSTISALWLTAFSALSNVVLTLMDALSSVDIVGVLTSIGSALSPLSGLVLGLLGPWGMLANVILTLATQTTLFTDIIKLLKGEMSFEEVVTNLGKSFEQMIQKFVDLATKLIPLGTEMIVSLLEGMNDPTAINMIVDVVTSIIDALVTAVPMILGAGLMMMQTLISGIGQALPMLVATYISIVETMIQTLVTAIPMIVEVAIQLITTIVETIVTVLPMLIEVAIQLITTLVEGIVTALPMLIEVALLLVTSLLEAIVSLLPMLIEAALLIVMTIVEGIITVLPALIEVGLQIISTLVESIISMLPLLIDGAIKIVVALLEGIISALPLLLDAALQIITALVTGLITLLPQIVAVAVLLVVALVGAIIKMVPQLIDAGIKLITALVKGIIQLLPVIIAAGIQLIMALLKAIITLVPQLLSAGVQLITALVSGALSIMGALISAGASLIMGLLSAILNFIGSMLSAGVSLIGSLISGVISLTGQLISAGAGLITSLISKILSFVGQIFTAGVSIVKSMIDGVKSMASSMLSVGKDLVKGMIDGILSMGTAAVDAISGVVGGVVDKAKSLLKIKSPSRVFMSIGNDTIRGFEIGMERRKANVESVMSDITESLKDIAKKYAEEDAEINKKHYEEIKSIETRAREDIDKIQRAATDKKRRLTEDEIIRIRRIQETANKKTEEIEKKIHKESAKALEDHQKEKMETIKRFIDDKKSLDQLSLVEEAKVWEESLSLFEDGTKEKIKVQQEYKKAVEKVEKEIHDINKEYSDKMKQLDKETTEAIKQSTKDYEDAFKERFKTVHDFAGLFDEFVVKQERSGEDMINNLESQVQALLEWDKTMRSLEGKIGDDRLLGELTALGPKALGDLQAINDMTEQELNQFVDLYKKKYAYATNIVGDEMQGMRDKHDEHVSSLKEEANKKADELTQEWALKMQEFVGVTDNRLKPLKQVGIDAGQGLYNGLQSMEGPLLSLAQKIADGIRDTIQSALDIHSPSRVMKGLGQNIGEGLYLGMDSTIRDIESSAMRLSRAALPNASLGGHSSGAPGGLTQNITVVSPEPTDAYENARAFKRAQQQLALDW